MKTYIVLLRGINVSGKNKIQMAELKNLLLKLEFQNIKTYIQSGNIVLDAKETKSKVCKKIQEIIALRFDYDVPVLAKTVKEWEKVFQKNPYVDREDYSKVYFTFLQRKPKETLIEVNKAPEDEYTIIDDVVYLYCGGGYGNTKLSNRLFEKKLKTKATTRNYNTTVKLLELATNK
ncbi:MAG: DUF1697 domain-containing protein [Flavobacteriaceae bacterium]|nr:DUF1697 domain-containing protein [Flavobacteriaceae bacterium]